MIARRIGFVAGASAVALLAALTLGGVVLAQGKWQAPAEAKKMKNPVPKSDKVIAQGKKLVETNCVPCHGAGGKGDGPAAAALPVKPADWTSKAVQEETDGEIFWKITNGRGPMPPWKHLPENDRWALVYYIRTLKK
jgi:mono/diheme cytochrome c family protein